MDYQEKRNLYNARKTTLEMLKDRGYEIPEQFFGLSFEDFLLLLEQNNLDLYFEHTDKKPVYVSFMHEYIKNITKKELDAAIENIKEKLGENFENVSMIFIFRTIQNKANKELFDRMGVQYFTVDNLVFNITNHELVPKHTPLTKVEVKELLKKYNCKLSQLPKLPKSDPISKYYGLKSGDVVRIERRSPSAGMHIFYRHIK